MSGSYDLECALATGGVGATFDKVFYNASAMDAVKDGAMLAVSNLAAQVVSLGKLMPLPNGLGHVADAVGTGIMYAVGNQIHRTSPFDNVLAQAVSGMVADYAGEHIVLPAIHSVSPM